MHSEPMLIPRYLGGKSGAKYPVWDGQKYDLLLSPFGGSLRQEVIGIQKRYVKIARAADSDPAVRAVYYEWERGGLRMQRYEQTSLLEAAA